jgi:hypothetical protein
MPVERDTGIPSLVSVRIKNILARHLAGLRRMYYSRPVRHWPESSAGHAAVFFGAAVVESFFKPAVA